MIECNKLQNLRSELFFFIITKSDPSFMHLDIFDKFLYIFKIILVQLLNLTIDKHAWLGHVLKDNCTLIN